MGPSGRVGICLFSVTPRLPHILAAFVFEEVSGDYLSGGEDKSSEYSEPTGLRYMMSPDTTS